MKAKNVNCKVCGKEIAASAKTCPKCGAKNKKLFYKKWWFSVLAIVLIFSFAGTGCSASDDTEIGAQEPVSVEMPSQTSDKGIGESITTPDDQAKEDNVPSEYKSALKKAKYYSELMHMSKAGIYDQLTSEYGEKFPEDAAQYAMDNLDVDYKENALKKAESYSETMYMSQAGIYDQLTSEYGEKFTEEEAQYAVDNLVADYNANALAKAKSYQETMSMSKAAIYDQLVSEYGEQFTKEEAQYAIDNLE